MQTPLVTYSKEEEMANTWSHIVGAVAAGLACLFMILKSSELTEWGRVGVWVYAFCIVLAFTCSSLYHGTKKRRKKFLFKKLDHISIYFLISGSYTVLILNRLMNSEGLLFLASLWGMTLVGIWFKARYVHRFKVFSTAIYVLMGYILFFDPWLFFGALNHDAKILLVISGAFYTIGAGFYLWKSMKWTHFTWHIFVIVAASLHFSAVYVELFP